MKLIATHLKLIGRFTSGMDTMDPIEFVDSIYLGDRACKAIILDGWASEVKLQVDCISRVRGKTWNFYRAEDLKDGFIVFENVSQVEWGASGHIPNDIIQSLTAKVDHTLQAKFVFQMEIASYDKKTLKFFQVVFKIHADAISLEPHGSRDRIRV